MIAIDDNINDKSEVWWHDMKPKQVCGWQKMTKVDDMAWMSQMTHSVVICGLYGYWWHDGVLKPLEMAIVHKKC